MDMSQTFEYVTDMTQVHSLCTRGRYREAFNSFWNLGAELSNSNIIPRIIGLTATLRPEDVADVLKRQSIKQAVVYRVSCHRDELKFQFNTVKTEADAITLAVKLAISKSVQTTVLVYGTTVKLCETIGDQIKSSFPG